MKRPKMTKSKRPKTKKAAKAGKKRGVKKGSKRKPSHKLAGQLINFKVTKSEKKFIFGRATKWTGGNLSKFIRHQLIKSPVQGL